MYSYFTLSHYSCCLLRSYFRCHSAVCPHLVHHLWLPVEATYFSFLHLIFFSLSARSFDCCQCFAADVSVASRRLAKRTFLLSTSCSASFSPTLEWYSGCSVCVCVCARARALVCFNGILFLYLFAHYVHTTRLDVDVHHFSFIFCARSRGVSTPSERTRTYLLVAVSAFFFFSSIFGRCVCVC